jgi:hypothetical protein
VTNSVVSGICVLPKPLTWKRSRSPSLSKSWNVLPTPSTPRGPRPPRSRPRRSHRAVAIQAIAGDVPVAFRDAVRVPDAGDEPIEVAVAVIVADRRSHAVAVGEDGEVAEEVESASAVVAVDAAVKKSPVTSRSGQRIAVDVGEVRGEPIEVVAGAEGDDPGGQVTSVKWPAPSLRQSW